MYDNECSVLEKQDRASFPEGTDTVPAMNYGASQTRMSAWQGLGGLSGSPAPGTPTSPDFYLGRSVSHGQTDHKRQRKGLPDTKPSLAEPVIWLIPLVSGNFFGFLLTQPRGLPLTRSSPLRWVQRSRCRSRRLST